MCVFDGVYVCDGVCVVYDVCIEKDGLDWILDSLAETSLCLSLCLLRN